MVSSAGRTQSNARTHGRAADQRKQPPRGSGSNGSQPKAGYSGASGFQAQPKSYASLTGVAPSSSTQTLEQRVAAFVKEQATYATANGPTSTPVPAEKQKQIADALMSMPSYVLERMMKDKLEFHIFTKMPPGEEKTGAGYCWSKPPILILNDEVFKGTNTAVLGTVKNCVVHEMGHYYDDALVKDTKADKAKGLYTAASSSDPEVARMFKEYKQRFLDTLESFTQTSGLDGVQGLMDSFEAASSAAAVGQIRRNPMPERDQWNKLTAAQRAALSAVVFDGGYSATNSGEFIGMATEKFFGSPEDRAYLQRVCPEVFAWLSRTFERA